MQVHRISIRQAARLTLSLLLGVLGACDDSDDPDGACRNGTPSCAAGSNFNAATCTCERMKDAAVDSTVDSAVLDSGTTFTDAGVECCVPSAKPACCMAFGGAKSVRGYCGAVCDGMPTSSDPAWRLVIDRFGCPAWSAQGATGACCGSPPPPADASTPPVYSCSGGPVSLPD